MSRARAFGLGFLTVWGIAAVWILAWNAGRASHTVRQLPSPCSAPMGLAGPGTSTVYQNLRWTCTNGVWVTDGVQQ